MVGSSSNPSERCSWARSRWILHAGELRVGGERAHRARCALKSTVGVVDIRGPVSPNLRQISGRGSIDAHVASTEFLRSISRAFRGFRSRVGVRRTARDVASRAWPRDAGTSIATTCASSRARDAGVLRPPWPSRRKRASRRALRVRERRASCGFRGPPWFWRTGRGTLRSSRTLPPNSKASQGYLFDRSRWGTRSWMSRSVSPIWGGCCPDRRTASGTRSIPPATRAPPREGRSDGRFHATGVIDAHSDCVEIRGPNIGAAGRLFATVSFRDADFRDEAPGVSAKLRDCRGRGCDARPKHTSGRQRARRSHRRALRRRRGARFGADDWRASTLTCRGSPSAIPRRAESPPYHERAR